MTTKTSSQRLWAGLLLSALVFPGLGQLYHGDRLRGVLLMSAALCCLGVLFVRVFQSVWSLMQSQGYVSLTPAYIHMVTESVRRGEGPFLTRVSLLLLIIWITGAVDAWIRAPRKVESAHL